VNNDVDDDLDDYEANDQRLRRRETFESGLALTSHVRSPRRAGFMVHRGLSGHAEIRSLWLFAPSGRMIW
jgi:hypothetical protein